MGGEGEAVSGRCSDEDEDMPPHATQPCAFNREIEEGSARFFDTEFCIRGYVVVASVVGFGDVEIVIEEAACEVGSGDAAETWGFGD